MHVTSRPSDPFRQHPRRTCDAAFPLALAVLIVLPAAPTVHAQSPKRGDRVPSLPATITIDAEGIARDARDTPSPAAPTMPDVERPDLPAPSQPKAALRTSDPSAAEREALIAAARQRHPERSRATIEAMVRRIAAELNFDAEFVAVIARIESGFDPFAVSDRGAIGVMQLMPPVIQDQGLADPFDAETNIRAGVMHLKALGQDFRHPVLVAAAYHAGAEAVRSARGIPKGPRTAEYVVAVLNGFYDLMAIAAPDGVGPPATRPSAARPQASAAASRASPRPPLRTARAEAAAPSNPTGIWERGFVLHLD